MTDHPIDPQIIAWARLAEANDHGPLLTDESAANLIRAEMLASIETCDHCDMHAMPSPASNQRWAVEHVHDLDCPRHDDNTDAVIRDATPKE